LVSSSLSVTYGTLVVLVLLRLVSKKESIVTTNPYYQCVHSTKFISLCPLGVLRTLKGQRTPAKSHSKAENSLERPLEAFDSRQTTFEEYNTTFDVVGPITSHYAFHTAA
jgi:hypothetical protein